MYSRGTEVKRIVDRAQITLTNDEILETKDDLIFEEPISFDPPEMLVRSNATKEQPLDAYVLPQANLGGSAADVSPRLPYADISGGISGEAFGVGSGTGQGLSHSANDFAAYVGNLRETGLDVVFVVDVTGSMDWVIEEVNDRIFTIVDTVRSLVPVTRLGIVAYRDFNDTEFVTKVQPLTFSTAKLQRFVANTEAKGGGSLHEAIDAAIDTAIESAGWRVESKKVIILIGDAPAHEKNFAELIAKIRRFAASGAQVSTLDVSLESNPALVEASVGRPVNRNLYREEPMFHYRAIADAGNGVAATMDGDIRIARQLLNLVFGGRFPEEIAILSQAL